MGTSWRAATWSSRGRRRTRRAQWQAQLYAGLTSDGFRLARPRRAADGSVCAHGWSATEFVPGRHEPRRWPEIIAVGERFHSTLRAVPRPGFLAERSSPWAVERPRGLGRGAARRRSRHPVPAAAGRGGPPVTDASRLIHGDLTATCCFTTSCRRDHRPLPVLAAHRVRIGGRRRGRAAVRGRGRSAPAGRGHIADFGAVPRPGADLPDRGRPAPVGRPVTRPEVGANGRPRLPARDPGLSPGQSRAGILRSWQPTTRAIRTPRCC